MTLLYASLPSKKLMTDKPLPCILLQTFYSANKKPNQHHKMLPPNHELLDNNKPWPGCLLIYLINLNATSRCDFFGFCKNWLRVYVLNFPVWAYLDIIVFQLFFDTLFDPHMDPLPLLVPSLNVHHTTFMSV